MKRRRRDARSEALLQAFHVRGGAWWAWHVLERAIADRGGSWTTLEVAA